MADMRPNDLEDEQQHSLTGFEVILIIMALAIVGFLYLYANRKPTWDDVHREQAAKAEVERKYNELLEKTGRNDAEFKKPKPTKPPIITLAESKGYSFPSGRAEVTLQFESSLTATVIPQIVKMADEYGLDMIEVVGHTDEAPLHGKMSNLDARLASVMNGVEGQPLVAVDNVGLGMARAVEVASILLRDTRIANRFQVTPYSGGQLIHTDGMLTRGGGWSDPGRRRIEIRLRKRGQ